MDNFRGAVMMVFAMASFAIEDMLIKLTAGAVPTSQIIFLYGLGGSLVFALLIVLRGQKLFPRDLLSKLVLLRCAGELVSTTSFVTALSLIPISTASAILQATPLAVTLGAALVLKEPVGWRRWSAICVGFIGVLIVLRPGASDFDVLSLFAVLAVVGLAVRDLATRGAHLGISSFQLSFVALLVLVPGGAALAQLPGQDWVSLTGRDWLLISGIVVFGAVSYYAIVAAMRTGEVSFVTPFRYSRILFALVIGLVVFGEHPDLPMLVGAGIVVASGIYMVWRERKQRNFHPVSPFPAGQGPV